MRNAVDWGGSSEMMDIDAALRRLRELPADPRLEQIDGAVMEAIVFQRRHGTPLSSTAFGVAAVLPPPLPFLGSVIPAPATPAPSLAPPPPPPPLPPSPLPRPTHRPPLPRPHAPRLATHRLRPPPPPSPPTHHTTPP